MPMGMLCRARLAVAETKNHPKVAIIQDKLFFNL